VFVLVGFALTFGGCIQDAHNANSDFNFDNPADPTPTNSSGILIADVDTTNADVIVVNSSGAAQDLTGWTLLNPLQPSTPYTFPNSFSFVAGAFVRVHTGTTTDSAPDLYGLPAVVLQGTVVNLTNGSSTVSTCAIGHPTCTQ
jgi:hypothetical protein